MPLPEGTVLTVVFTLDGREFMALNGGPVFKHSPAISFVAGGKTQKDLDRLWAKLSAGGKPDQCGWLTDKFGVSWQIVPADLKRMLAGKDAARRDRVLAAIMRMTKLDIAALKKAYG
jgi:predicted 3-demethylubiquinone-9 3-methyltransferase (glyoxalase superfamily)